ncbi:hypothetical protein DL96DRAFT_1821339 [Flagelloscypha sp. PMI_526]|nr:hypothetical protein DL96DRAFT_1821339 [Flagelloscypha sp. PMI_526]
MPFPELPADVLPGIFWETDLTTVFRGAAVSRVWRSQALPLLLKIFSCIRLSHSRYITRRESNPWRILALFTSVWPSYVHHVQQVCIDFAITPERAYEPATTKILNLLPKVRRFKIGWHDSAGLLGKMAIFQGVLETKIFPHLTHLTIDCGGGSIPLPSLLKMCPSLEELGFPGSMIADPFLEAQLQAIPKFHPLHKLFLWYSDRHSTWDHMIQFFRRFIEISGATITSFRIGRLDTDVTPFIKTIPWLSCFTETLRTLDLQEALFKYLVGCYVKNSNQLPLDHEELKVLKLASFPQLQTFCCEVLVSDEIPRIEIAVFFMDWLAHQASTLPPFHLLDKVRLDVVRCYRLYASSDLDNWDGENPPMPTIWPAMDAAFARREHPIHAEYILDGGTEKLDEMMNFIRNALPSLHERRLLRLVVTYNN